MVGIGLTATALISVLRSHVPQIAMLIGVLAGIAMLLMVMGNIQSVIRTLTDLSNAANVNHGFLTTVIRIIGLAYIVEFAAQVARDADSESLAGKIELAGKVGIVVLAIPIVQDVVESLVHLLP